jgi:hypothetical protein
MAPLTFFQYIPVSVFLRTVAVCTHQFSRMMQEKMVHHYLQNYIKVSQ